MASKEAEKSGNILKVTDCSFENITKCCITPGKKSNLGTLRHYFVIPNINDKGLAQP